MNAIKLIGTYSSLLDAIATAAKGTPHTLTKEQGEENKAHKANVATSIREYAKATAADDISTDDAYAALKLVLTAQEVKAGTVKGYGASFKGFRKMIDDNAVTTDGAALVDAANTADAQMYVASPDVKEAKNLRDRLKAATKGWTNAQLKELVEMAEAINTSNEADKTEQLAPESTESREARRAA